MKPPLPAAGLALILLCAAACGDGGEPVARLTLTPSTLTLPYPGIDRLRVRWEPLEPFDELPHVFVHLIDQPGNVLRTYDFPFRHPWSPGEEVEVVIPVWQSALAPPLPPGGYQLTLGLYDPGSGRRWPLQVDGLEVGGLEVDRGEYAVARVEVPAAGATPEIEFSESWFALEPTGDRQLFAVRWLGADDGWIALTGLAEPTTLALTLRLPRLEEEGFRLLLDEGTEVPRVTLTSECGGEMATLEGLGLHQVELPLTPAEPGERCTVTLDPHFVFLEESTFGRRTLLLEKLLWYPAGPATAG